MARGLLFRVCNMNFLTDRPGLAALTVAIDLDLQDLLDYLEGPRPWFLRSFRLARLVRPRETLSVLGRLGHAKGWRLSAAPAAGLRLEGGTVTIDAALIGRCYNSLVESGPGVRRRARAHAMALAAALLDQLEALPAPARETSRRTAPGREPLQLAVG